ncbi:MAG: cytidine deaminase [Actinobacteria bacterium]|nr:cytidine deaminase [Actinomycetota bacterium]NBP91341.1 cytidine deaminase [Actinomycetota bacterium]
MSENEKLRTLAKSTALRLERNQGAAVRDLTGRTYAATNVSLPSLTLDALEATLAAAISSGATGIEAFALWGEPASSRALTAMKEFAPQAEQV